MNGIKLLDCTLREAPLEQQMWGDFSLRKVLNQLSYAGVDIVEVGFLKDGIHIPGSASFCKTEEIAQYLETKNPSTMYVALVDYGRYDLSNLSEYDGKSIDAIRVCFKHSEIDQVLDYAMQIREKGYKVCIQHVDTMGFSDSDIISFIKKVNQFRPYAYSIVDTFGAMYSSDLMHYIEIVDRELRGDIWLGFHAHNNLMLADSNAQLFVESLMKRRNIIVDASLFGCGRSAGNAHTELIAQYINVKHGYTYDIDNILDLIDTVITAVSKKTTWGYSIPYFISGIYNAHTFNVNQLMKRHNLKSKDLRGIIEMLDDKKKKEYDYALLEKLYVKYFDKPINDSEALEGIRSSLSGRKVLLLGPGKSVIEERDKIDTFIDRESPIIIGVNNLIEGYKQDYIFYSSSVRFNDLKYQDYAIAGCPQIIVTSNIGEENWYEKIIVNYSSLIEFGWINIDSSFIMLIRLLLNCGVSKIYVAGIDGYGQFGDTFYKSELETNLDDRDRILQTQENIEMLKSIMEKNPNLSIRFISKSLYEEFVK